MTKQEELVEAVAEWLQARDQAALRNWLTVQSPHFNPFQPDFEHIPDVHDLNKVYASHGAVLLADDQTDSWWLDYCEDFRNGKIDAATLWSSVIEDGFAKVVPLEVKE